MPVTVTRGLNSIADNIRMMAFIRYGEERTYVPGVSQAYLYPNGNGEIVVRTPGVMDSGDFWEIVCRAVERVEGEDEAEKFARQVEEYRNE